MARNRKRAKERQRTRRPTTDPGSGRGVATARGARGPAPESVLGSEAPGYGAPSADEPGLDPDGGLGTLDSDGGSAALDSEVGSGALDSEGGSGALDSDGGSEVLDSDGGSEVLEPATPGSIEHATPDVELAEAQLALGRAEAAGELAPQFSSDDDEFAEDFEADGDLEGGGSSDGGRGSSGRGGGGGLARSGGGGEMARSGDAAPAPRSLPGGRLVNFLQGSWRELQRVQWPDRRQVMQATGVVIGFVIVAGVFLGLADLVASNVVKFILK